MLKSNSERVRKLKHLKIMDNKKRAKILMEVLTNVLARHFQTQNSSSTIDCCKFVQDKKLPLDQVFFAFVLSLMTAFIISIMASQTIKSITCSNYVLCQV